MLRVIQHDVQAEQDFHLLRTMGIRAARDGVRWPCVEKTAGEYDFSSFLPMVQAANRQGVQIVWNLLHYGWPDHLELMSTKFIDSFARFATAIARLVKNESDDVPVYVPVNEISFLAWAIGHKEIIHPVQPGQAWQIKQQLVRAAIAAMEAVWAVDPRARFAHVDPVIHVIPPRDRPDLAQEAAGQRNAQWDAWEMLRGQLCPEVGGHPKYLDIVGINYYHANQWETPDIRLRWEDEPRDSRWVPFHQLLDEVHERFKRPLFIAETSHFGSGRARWIREIAQEVYIARMQGVPLEGLCMYPILDRPDWEDMHHWHNSGLWDLHDRGDGTLQRVLHDEYAVAVRESQALLAEIGCR
jgi:hypothetical protein